MILRRFIAFLLVAILCAFSGCIFSPHKKPPGGPSPPIYPHLDNPYSVLDALAMAYTAKDSNEVKVLYDSLYIGTSIDQVDQTNLSFTRALEVAHVASLAKSLDIRSVLLEFPPSKTRFTDQADPPGWATVQILQNMHVTVDTAARTYLLYDSGVTTEFKFIPKTPDPSSTTDTTWKIVRWSENHQ